MKRKIAFEEVKLAREDFHLRSKEYYNATSRREAVESEYALGVLDLQVGDWIVNPDTGVEFRIMRVMGIDTDGTRALIHGFAGVNDVDFWVELKKQ